MGRPNVLFLSIDDDVQSLVDPAFQQEFNPVFFNLTRQDHVAIERPDTLKAVVLDGYSELLFVRRVPGAERLLGRVAPLLPRIYLLRDASPTLEPDRIDRTQGVLTLRGPVGPARLRLGLQQLIGKRHRHRRFDLDVRLQIGTHFTLRRRDREEMFYREVLEMGPEGMSFLWSREAPPLFPGDRLIRVSLVARGDPFWTTEAVVRHLSPLREGAGRHSLRVGVEFAAPVVAAADLAERPVFEQSHLTDPMLVRATLREVVERGTPVQICPEGLGEEIEARIVEIGQADGIDSLTLRLRAAPVGDAWSTMDMVIGLLIRDNAQLRFNTVILERQDNILTLRMPRRLERLWSRSNLRYTPPADEPLTVQVFSPLLPWEPQARQVVDLSPDGLSFRARASADLLLPGMQLPQVSLDLGRGLPVRAVASVRHLAPSPESPDQVICGIRFTEMDRPTQHRLVDYLISKSFPRVRTARDDDATALWDFLEHTNYLSEAKRRVQLYPEEEIRATQARLLRAPAHLSRTLLYTDQDEIHGTISLTRIFSHTWMVHHLAAAMRVAALVPRHLLLYLGEYISKTPDIEYVRMMWRPNNNWSNRMLGRLIHRLHNHEQSVVKHYTYLDMAADALPPVGDDGGWKVRRLAPSESAELEIHFVERREFFLMKAEDLHRQDPHLSGLNERYGQSNLRRHREILIAERGGTVGGFCLVELGSPAFNLSNLLNAFRLVLTRAAEGEADTVGRVLALAAGELYAETGQRRVVALVEDPEADLLERQGFERQKEYISWTFGQDIASFYNLYCHYVFRVYERLDRRLRSRSQRRVHVDEIGEAQAEAEESLGQRLKVLTF